jgi:hypothetical protein
MPPEREMNSRADNARRFRINADTGETAIEIELPETLPNGRQPASYLVVKKDVPTAALNQSYRGKKVIWINCFGVRLRDANRNNPFIEEVSGEQFEYEVIVPAASKPEGYETLVYFDGTNVQPAPNPSLDNNEYHFKLNIGDPAAGWGGGG